MRLVEEGLKFMITWGMNNSFSCLIAVRNAILLLSFMLSSFFMAENHAMPSIRIRYIAAVPISFILLCFICLYAESESFLRNIYVNI